MEESNNPKISAIIPVYNVEKYLPQCIESIINQTYKNLEIILIDDGSQDNSGFICDEYAKKDLRIKVIHKANSGLSEARNNGIKQANGEYLFFLDSDDWIDPETCEVAINASLAHDLDIVLWAYKKEFSNNLSKIIPLFNNNILFEGEELSIIKRRVVGLVNDELRNPTKTDALNSAWGKMYRKKMLDQLNLLFIDTKVVGSEDVIFNIQAFHKAEKIKYLNFCFNHYRQDNPNALTKNHGSTLFPRFQNLFKFISEFINKNKLSDDYLIALNNRIVLSIINNVLSITSKNNNSDHGFKYKNIYEILNNPTYKNAIAQFDMHYLPIHWRFFFMLCKYKVTSGVILMAYLMRVFK